jgi:hypothetical protein
MGSGYRVFTAGEVLTASNVQDYLMDQSVMSFADSTARATSIGTANFEEGMLSYLQDTNQLEVYNGASWASIAPTTTQGLTLINTTSFSGVASQSVNSVFSSTYANYLVLMNMTTSTTMTPQFRFRTASDDTTSNYNIQHLEASVSTVTATRNLNTNIMGLTPTTFNGKLIYSMQFLSPNQAVETQGFISTSIYMNLITSAFYQNTSDQYTGFTVIASTGTISGTLRVFGYNN